MTFAIASATRSPARTPAVPKRMLAVLIGAGAVMSCVSSPALAGRIVVNHDEWTMSDAGFNAAGGTNAETFAQNVVKFLDTDGTAGGNVLVYSNNFGFGGDFTSALAADGYTATQDTAAPFTLANLLNYDAVYLGGGSFSEDDAVLAAYVQAGGGVYIAAGTGDGGAAAEAARWNGFLSGFGLALDGSGYNGIGGVLAVTGTHAIFNGVQQLYYNNGNSVSTTGDPSASIVQGPGLIGVYDNVSAVPEAQTYALLLAGLGVLGFVARTRSKR